MKTYLTPGTTHKIQVQERDESKCIFKEEHTLFCSGVGMLLYLAKHLQPDIANPVRELLKVLDEATQEAFKELHRVIKYVLDTKTRGLKLKIRPTFDSDS